MKNTDNLHVKRLLRAAVICLSLLGVTGSAVVGAGEITFGQAEPLGPMVNSNRGEFDVTFSTDGLEIYFTSNRHRPEGLNDFDVDIYVTTRDDINAPWKPPISLGSAVNSSSWDEDPFLTSDGLTLYFDSLRPWGVGDLWMTTRKTKDDDWGPAVNLGPIVNNQDYTDEDPSLTADGLELYFSSDRSGPRWQYSLWVTTRETVYDNWRDPVDLGPVVNGTHSNTSPTISPDGLVLVFNRDNSLWLMKRTSRTDAWGEPERLGSTVNIMNLNTCPDISPDGRWLRWASTNDYPGVDMWDIWQAPIFPAVDLNGDGQVNATDGAILIDHWGQNEPSCDIGPFAWGDGVVDGKDLSVLSQYADADLAASPDPASGASDVPVDVSLSWSPGALAVTHDVYLGTSLLDVTNASRENPLSALVSQNQDVNAYELPKLRDYGRTYYWRVDEVDELSESGIAKGIVWSFTTQLPADPVENVIAIASSADQGCGPELTIDGSGLNATYVHSIQAGTMWLSAANGPQPTWIQYEFDAVYPLNEMWVWNYNGQFEQILGNGLKDVLVEYSDDGVSWTSLGEFEFARATSQSDYGYNTVVEFGGAQARYVRLTAQSNWGGLTHQYGLSEVRFLCDSTAGPVETTEN